MLDKNAVRATDVSYFSKYYDTQGYYKYVLGENYYKLLTYLSSLLPNDSVVLDCGTCIGHSALALGQNPDVDVYSYDITPRPIAFKDDYKNIRFIIDSIFNIDGRMIKSAELIFLDIDPHNGVMETNFVNKLIENNFHGTLILDDIHLNDGMEHCWREIQSNKDLISIDITDIGHITGTGLVYFNEHN